MPEVFALEFKCHNVLKYNAYFTASHVKSQMESAGVPPIDDFDWMIFAIYQVIGDTGISDDCIYSFVKHENIVTIQYNVDYEKNIVIKIRKKYTKPNVCETEADVTSGYLIPPRFKQRYAKRLKQKQKKSQA